MYKRRDWLHVHGADGGLSSDSDSSDESARSSQGDEEADDQGSGSEAEADVGDDDGAVEGLSEDDDGSAEDGSDGEEQDPDAAVDPSRRLEDLSESEYEEDSNDEELQSLMSAWMGSTAAPVKGRPLRCRVCPGVLMLNAPALRQHVGSKRHRRRLAASKLDADDPTAPVCWAEELRANTEEAETHAERLARIRAQLSADDGRPHGSDGGAEEQAAAGEDAGEASADDTDADEEQPAARPGTDADSSGRKHGKDAAAVQEKHGDQKPVRGKKKGKRKRDPERKRPGKRQRAEIKQQLLASGSPGGGAEGPAVDGKGSRRRTKGKRPGRLAIGQQMPAKLSVAKPLRTGK